MDGVGGEGGDWMVLGGEKGVLGWCWGRERVGDGLVGGWLGEEWSKVERITLVWVMVK